MKVSVSSTLSILLGLMALAIAFPINPANIGNFLSKRSATLNGDVLEIRRGGGSKGGSSGSSGSNSGSSGSNSGSSSGSTTKSGTSTPNSGSTTSNNRVTYAGGGTTPYAAGRPSTLGITPFFFPLALMGGLYVPWAYNHNYDNGLYLYNQTIEAPQDLFYPPSVTNDTVNILINCYCEPNYDCTCDKADDTFLESLAVSPSLTSVFVYANGTMNETEATIVNYDNVALIADNGKNVTLILYGAGNSTVTTSGASSSKTFSARSTSGFLIVSAFITISAMLL